MADNDLTVDQQIGLLADLTKRFGCLHEVQVLNLKRWPLICLGVKTSKCEYNHELRKLYFDVGVFFDGRRPDRFRDRLESLSKACKMLLGPDVEIAVTQFGRALYGNAGDKPGPEGTMADGGGTGNPA